MRVFARSGLILLLGTLLAFSARMRSTEAPTIIVPGLEQCRPDASGHVRSECLDRNEAKIQEFLKSYTGKEPVKLHQGTASIAIAFLTAIAVFWRRRRETRTLVVDVVLMASFLGAALLGLLGSAELAAGLAGWVLSWVVHSQRGRR
jgi:hypothetical protein